MPRVRENPSGSAVDRTHTRGTAPLFHAQVGTSRSCWGQCESTIPGHPADAGFRKSWHGVGIYLANMNVYGLVETLVQWPACSTYYRSGNRHDCTRVGDFIVGFSPAGDPYLQTTSAFASLFTMNAFGAPSGAGVTGTLFARHRELALEEEVIVLCRKIDLDAIFTKRNLASIDNTWARIARLSPKPSADRCRGRIGGGYLKIDAGTAIGTANNFRGQLVPGHSQPGAPRFPAPWSPRHPGRHLYGVSPSWAATPTGVTDANSINSPTSDTQRIRGEPVTVI